MARGYKFEWQIEAIYNLLMAGTPLAAQSQGPPPPLGLSREQIGRVNAYLDGLDESGEGAADRLLLVELLAALRSIDDKLTRLLERDGDRQPASGAD